MYVFHLYQPLFYFTYISPYFQTLNLGTWRDTFVCILQPNIYIIVKFNTFHKSILSNNHSSGLVLEKTLSTHAIPLSLVHPSAPPVRHSGDGYWHTVSDLENNQWQPHMSLSHLHTHTTPVKHTTLNYPSYSLHTIPLTHTTSVKHTKPLSQLDTPHQTTLPVRHSKINQLHNIPDQTTPHHSPS